MFAGEGGAISVLYCNVVSVPDHGFGTPDKWAATREIWVSELKRVMLGAGVETCEVYHPAGSSKGGWLCCEGPADAPGCAAYSPRSGVLGSVPVCPAPSNAAAERYECTKTGRKRGSDKRYVMWRPQQPKGIAGASGAATGDVSPVARPRSLPPPLSGGGGARAFNAGLEGLPWYRGSTGRALDDELLAMPPRSFLVRD